VDADGGRVSPALILRGHRPQPSFLPPFQYSIVPFPKLFLPAPLSTAILTAFPAAVLFKTVSDLNYEKDNKQNPAVYGSTIGV
jgi:hypothetical protein